MSENTEALTPAEDRPALEDRPAPSRVPLLEPDEKLLGAALRSLEAFLAALGFHHHSYPLAVVVSCFAFAFLGIAVPVASICLSRCSSESCEEYQVERFELCELVSEASLAAVSLVCISRNLSKYGIRKFLFVDQDHGRAERFQKEYFRKIQDFFCLLLWWILPCLLVKIACEIFRFIYIVHESKWKAVVVLLASIISWAYLTTVILSACILFYLVCNLQVIHFEDYVKLLERGADALVYLEEHVRLRYYLSKISHRFRIFLLLLFLFITASQFVILFQTTGYSGTINFTNAGGLAVSSIVQVVGIVLCLHAAAKISHRAQGVASLASRWHALITCSSTDSSVMRTTYSSANLEAIPANFLLDYSESDLESLDSATVQNNSQLVSYMSSYHKRHALVTYLQSNPGGITIFGWTVDRALVNTIFFLELTLVLFVLGKTIVFPTK